MTTQIATTQEQSARLLKCGVLADTADMSIRTIVEPYMCEDVAWHIPKLLTLPYSDSKDIYRGDEIVPAWSLSSLLSLLPTHILSPLGNEYRLELSTLRMHDEWEVQWSYNESRFATRDKQKVFHKLWDKSPIEACVKAVEWLTANGYKLKGGSDD